MQLLFLKFGQKNCKNKELLELGFVLGSFQKEKHVTIPKSKTWTNTVLTDVQHRLFHYYFH